MSSRQYWEYPVGYLPAPSRRPSSASTAQACTNPRHAAANGRAAQEAANSQRSSNLYTAACAEASKGPRHAATSRKQTPGSHTSGPKPRPSRDRQHVRHSLIEDHARHVNGHHRATSPGNSPWFRAGSKARQAASAQGPSRRSFDVRGKFSPPSQLSTSTSLTLQPLACETSSLLQNGSPDGMVFSPKENAHRGSHGQYRDYGDANGVARGCKASGGIPDGHAAHGGHSMKGVRTEVKGQQARFLIQRRASDAAAGSFNFKRTLQELSAGLSNTSKGSSSQKSHSRTPNSKVPEWMELLRDLH